MESSTPEAAGASQVPQFSTAEYAHIPGSERCQFCQNLLAGDYYRLNTLMACAACAQQARDGQPTDSHVAFVRALLFGAGAALAGLILYAGFTIVTNFYIGYVALAVGWMVAKAMQAGSKGMGGLRYQIAAVVLTYAAISLAAVPIWIHVAMKESPSHKTSATVRQQGAGSDAEQAPDDGKESGAPAKGLGPALLYLALLGIASPFLELADPVHGLIGLVILFVGLRIAFRMTAAKPIEVDGPYSLSA
ncbi:MAG: hypothetical protein WCE75_13230 [Terracidiphilus sp.]